MGSASVPSSTSQYQQVATGIWGSPQATKLALPILKPALGNIKEQQDMLLGVQHGDPSQLAAFFGLPAGSSPEDAGAAAHRYMSGPKIETSSQGAPSQPPAEPTKLAARGGLMSLDDDDERAFASGGDTTPKDITPKQAQQLATWQQQINSGKKLSPTNQRKFDSWTQTRQGFQQYTAQQDAGKANLAAQGITPAAAYMGQAGFFGGAYDPKTNTFSVTNPYYNQATDILRQMNKQPEQFGQATDAYNKAISGLGSLANYTPQQVAASQIGRGDIRDVQAQLAQVERMQGGPNVSAIEAQANQMQQPEDVMGQSYQAAQIAPTRRERAVTTAAPKSWTDPGVAQQYMDPYAQSVINQNLQEANRNFQKNLSALRGQAAKSKAYGGSRQGIEEAEALRNQGYLLADIQDKGLSQAYQSGMGQFQAEQGLGSQVGMSNTAQINQLKQQYMNMGLTEAQANQAAINAASQFGAQSAQQAALANQQAGLTTGQANLSAAQQTALANQQAGMTAQQLNQLYGQGGFQSQAANMAAQNAAYNNYVAQQLAAQQSNQQVDYNTAMQNAQLAQQAALANQQAGLQANQQNIGAYGAMGNMAGGLGSLGATVGNYNANLANMWGQAGSTLQGLGQNYFNQLQQNAANIYGGPTTLGNQGMNLLGGMGGGQSGMTNQIQKIQ